MLSFFDEPLKVKRR